MIKYISILITSILIITGCTTKTYYYQQDGKIEDVIKVKTDSEAYLKAYTNFIIAKKVRKDMNASFGDLHRSEIYSFDLLNEKKEIINPQFNDMAALMRNIELSIDSLPNDISTISKSDNDTVGLYKSPIKVTSSSLVKKEYSNYKDIRLTYKNVSNKPVSGIRFEWYGENAFGEPADMGSSFNSGEGRGFTDETLRPGKSTYGEWSILSRDAKKILYARPYEVVYSDGTKWKLRNN